MSKRLFKIISLSLLITISILLIYLILKSKTGFIDNKGYNFISKYICDTNTSIAKIFTFLGSTLFITTLCVLSLLLKKFRIQIISNTLLAVGISQLLKRVIQRARPIDIALIEETGYSFPSGHSMVAFAFYGLIIYLIYKSKLNIKLKILFIVLLSLLILGIGLSRIYLGVHYVTDVLGGYILGLLSLIIFIELIYKKYFLKKEN